MFDLHCHIDEPRLNGYALKEQSFLKGVLSCGISKKSWFEHINLADKPGINIGLGIHPCFVEESKDEMVHLNDLLARRKAVAIGEIGLDKKKPYDETFYLQQELFYEQLKIASKLALPVVIHCRKAYDECFKILSEIEVPAIIFHCFSGDERQLLEALKFNSFISYGFTILDKKSRYRELLRATPLKRVVLETDAPYMKPYNSKMNFSTPEDVRLVYQEVSDICCEENEYLIETIRTNILKILKNLKKYNLFNPVGCWDCCKMN